MIEFARTTLADTYAISDASAAFAEELDELADRIRTGTPCSDLAEHVARLARMMGGNNAE